jgi:hypothetical protein
VTVEQDAFLQSLTERLVERSLNPRTVGVSDFGNDAPLTTVRRLLDECHGALVVGLAQTLVVTGVSKPGTSREAPIANQHLPTPWNQLEAGIAFAMNLPLLIVRERSVHPDGVFDPQIADRFVHQADLTSEWLGSPAFLQPLNEWVADCSAHRRTRDE